MIFSFTQINVKMFYQCIVIIIEGQEKINLISGIWNRLFTFACRYVNSKHIHGPFVQIIFLSDLVNNVHTRSITVYPSDSYLVQL